MKPGLERVIELAREDRPASLPPGEADRLIDSALASRRAGKAPSRPWLAVAALAACLALLAPRVEPPAPPAELVLATGDRVLTAADSRVELLAVAPGERRLRLVRGSALFTVAPGHGAFVVTTRDSRVEVRGTVFTVRQDSSGTEVRVYEGRVAVFHAGQEHLLAAGASWGSAGPPAGADRLAAAAEVEAERRAPRVVPLEARLEAGPEPTPEPEPAGPSVPVPPPADAGPPAPPPPPRRPAPPDDDELRFWIRSGRAADALAEVRRRRGPAYRVVEADALRALGRIREAAETYLVAARDLDAPRLGYLAARLYLDELGAPKSALAALDATGADAPGSPLEERALALRARASQADEACAVAARYLARFPTGGHAAELARLPGCRP